MTHSGKAHTQNKINLHLIVAMQSEADFIIKKLKLIKLSSSEMFLTNVDIYHAEFEHYSVHLFVHKKNDGMDKIGTVHAALLTYKSILFLKPDIILSVGTSGGIHARSVAVFDLVCAHNFVIYHDRFSGDDENSIKQSLGFLPCVDFREQFKTFQFKHGVIATSNSLIVDSNSWKIMNQHNVMCVDMEAAGVAEVANEFSIPFSALKIVTDNVYEVNPIDALPQFFENFDAAMTVLAETLELCLLQKSIQI